MANVPRHVRPIGSSYVRIGKKVLGMEVTKPVVLHSTFPTPFSRLFILSVSTLHTTTSLTSPDHNPHDMCNGVGLFLWLQFFVAAHAQYFNTTSPLTTAKCTAYHPPGKCELTLRESPGCCQKVSETSVYCDRCSRFDVARDLTMAPTSRMSPSLSPRRPFFRAILW